MVIYTQRSFDPGLPIQLSEYAMGDRLQRLYLDRLPPEWEGRSLEVRAIQLMGVRKDIVADQAKSLIEQVRTESNNDTTLKAVLELINTIFIYKFPDLTRQEIEVMLGISELKQTRVYQEARQEEKLEIISRMVPLGLTVEQIAQVVNLTIEEVQQIIQQESQADTE